MTSPDTLHVQFADNSRSTRTFSSYLNTAPSHHFRFITIISHLHSSTTTSQKVSYLLYSILSSPQHETASSHSLSSSFVDEEIGSSCLAATRRVSSTLRRSAKPSNVTPTPKTKSPRVSKKTSTKTTPKRTQGTKRKQTRGASSGEGTKNPVVTPRSKTGSIATPLSSALNVQSFTQTASPSDAPAKNTKNAKKRPVARARTTKSARSATPLPSPPGRQSNINPQPDAEDGGDESVEPASKRRRKQAKSSTNTPHQCPTEKVRTLVWSLPFISVLDMICCTEITDLSKWYDTMFPSPSSMQFNNRTEKYAAINNGIGRVVYELQDFLGIPVQTATTVVRNNRIYAQAKKNFETRYNNSLALMKRLRKAIGNLPSIYWYYSSDVIIRLFTEYQGGPLTEAASGLFQDILGRYINDLYSLKEEQCNRFMYSAPNIGMITGVSNISEHACRTFWDLPYEQGVKESRSNTEAQRQNESPRSYYGRTAIKQAHEIYRNNIVAVTGYKLAGGENGRGLRDHPLSDLCTHILGYFGSHTTDNVVNDAKVIVSGLVMELDTAMRIAEHTPAPSNDSIEDLSTQIYGHRIDDDFFVKPWNAMSHHTAFFRQSSSMYNVISGQPDQRPTNEDVVEAFKMFLFQVLVQDFTGVFATSNDACPSIFETRMTEYLTK